MFLISLFQVVQASKPVAPFLVPAGQTVTPFFVLHIPCEPGVAQPLGLFILDSLDCIEILKSAIPHRRARSSCGSDFLPAHAVSDSVTSCCPDKKGGNKKGQANCLTWDMRVDPDGAEIFCLVSPRPLLHMMDTISSDAGLLADPRTPATAALPHDGGPRADVAPVSVSRSLGPLQRRPRCPPPTGPQRR